MNGYLTWRNSTSVHLFFYFQYITVNFFRVETRAIKGLNELVVKKIYTTKAYVVGFSDFFKHYFLTASGW